MTRHTFAAALVAGTLAAGGATASSFSVDVSLDFTGSSLNFIQKIRVLQAYQVASDFYEANITGYAVADAVLQGVSIAASVPAIDGVGGILGQAGPTTFYGPLQTSNDLFYTRDGIMQFDSADVRGLLRDGTFGAVVQHEMAHVLGFGTLWTLNGLYQNNSGEYAGANALAAYQDEFDAGATFIPVELDGGPGTANGHWDEDWAGGSSELMTGFLDDNPFFSQTTLYAFRDLGYTTVDDVILPASLISLEVFRERPALAGLLSGKVTLNDIIARIAPVPVPPAALALLGALGLLAGLRRRAAA